MATPQQQTSALPGLFVTGTDTGVGKTRIASAIASVLSREGLRVGVLKPVATGAERIEGVGWRSEDAEALIAAIDREVPLDRVAPLLFEAPLAPPVAARESGTTLQFDNVLTATRTAIDWWAGPGGAEILVVEGVGGLLCPLAEGATVADLAVALDFPLLIVARRGLGTLNHTLLTLEAARLRGLRIAGVVLNGSEATIDPLAEATNPIELSRRLGEVPFLADLPHGADLAALLGREHNLDWNERAAPPRTLGPTARLAGAS